MLCWESIALGYVSYLAITSLAFPRFVRARRVAVAAAILCWPLMPVVSSAGIPEGIRGLFPALVLLAGYWLSGSFFVGPMPRVEMRLRRLDEVLLDRTGVRARYRQARPLVHHAFELAYLLAYPMVPAGALLLLAGGHADRLGPFWATVMLAAFAAYGVLPWVQTRPPRGLGPKAGPPHPVTALRRLNQSVLDRASVQVNTIPSGHTAAALAVALAVIPAMPVAGALLLALALLIAAATVLGGYHYALDSVLGVLVAFGACALVNALG